VFFFRACSNADRFRFEFRSPANAPQNTCVKYALESTLVPLTTSHFAGLFDGSALHLTPVSAVVQMNPSFDYIDEQNERVRSLLVVTARAFCR
jgi:hypothetical protein